MEKDLHTYSFSRGVPANRLVMTLMQFRRFLEGKFLSLWCLGLLHSMSPKI